MIEKAKNEAAGGPSCYVTYHFDLVINQIPVALSDEPDAAGIRWIRSPLPFFCVALRTAAANAHLAMLIAFAKERYWLMSERGSDVVFALFGPSPGEADALFRSWGCTPGTFTVQEPSAFGSPAPAELGPTEPSPGLPDVPPNFDPEQN